MNIILKYTQAKKRMWCGKYGKRLKRRDGAAVGEKGVWEKGREEECKEGSGSRAKRFPPGLIQGREGVRDQPEGR